MTKTWWEAPMGGSVLSFLKAEWKEPLVVFIFRQNTIIFAQNFFLDQPGWVLHTREYKKYYIQLFQSEKENQKKGCVMYINV